MATNNPYENDPYGQMSTGAQIKDFALSPYRPGTWLSLYGSNPFMWSMEKGVYVPFIGRHIETGGRFIPATLKHIGRSYEGRGIIGGTVTAARRTIGALHKGGMVGKRWLGNTPARHAATGLSSVREKISRQLIRNEIISSEIGAINERLSGITGNYLGANKGKLRGIAKGRRMLLDELAPYEEMLSAGKKNLSRYQKTASRLASKVGSATRVRTVAKLGIAGAKGVSIVGAAMFAWDMMKMVGEPLGAYAMNELYRGATNMQNRFMPEMGGQLAMSFLSRGAATERQRALMAMSKASITGRSAFGQEAALMHQ